MDPRQNAQGEELLAVLGLDGLLAGDRVRVTQGLRDEGAKLPARYRRELRRFLSATSFDRMPSLAAPGYRKALEQMTTPPDPAARARQFAGVDHDEAAALTVALDQALATLRPLLPRTIRMTASGPRMEAVPAFAMSRWRRAYAMANEPGRLFAQLNAGTLLREEVHVFAVIYPSLYEGMTEDVPPALAANVAASAKWELSSRRDRLLRVLLQAETVDAKLAARLKLPASPGAGGGGHPPAAHGGPAERTETPVGRVSAA